MVGPRLTGPRLTAPAKQLARSITTTTNAGAVPQATTLITSSRTVAPLSQKYVELLKEKNMDGEVRCRLIPSSLPHRLLLSPLPRVRPRLVHALTWSLLQQRSRHIYTRSANRPHPPPKRMRLMQTFTSSASRPAASESKTIDCMVLPNLQEAGSYSTSGLRVPILPDNYNVHHAPEASIEPVMQQGQINVVAADPDSVSVSPLTEVEGMTLDGVELKFAHESSQKGSEPESGMLKDLWKGLVDDVFGSKPGKLAV